MDERDKLDAPYDIIRNILVRLPVKSLHRFKAVSRAYLTTICDPKFASAHLYQSKTLAPKSLFIQKCPCREVKLTKIENQKCQVESVLQYPLKEYGPSHMLCGCDGLLIFFCGLRRHDLLRMWLFLLWNPSSRTCKPFWPPWKLGFMDLLYFGLCYDPLIEDYKLIVTDMRQYSAIFYCTSNYWTEREESLLDGAIRTESLRHGQTSLEGVCFGEALYWLLYDLVRHQYEIICFDSREDKYKIMHKPEVLQKNIDDRCYLASFGGGHLCLSRNMSYNSTIQIFILKKDSADRDTWIEFITIDVSSVPMFSEYSRPIILTNENEIILQVTSYNFVVYNPSKRTFAKIKRKCRYLIYGSVPYQDNLFLSNGRSTTEECVWIERDGVKRCVLDGFERRIKIRRKD